MAFLLLIAKWQKMPNFRQLLHRNKEAHFKVLVKFQRALKSWITGIRRPSSGSGPAVIVWLWCYHLAFAEASSWLILGRLLSFIQQLHRIFAMVMIYSLTCWVTFLNSVYFSLIFFLIFKNLVGIKIKTFLLVSWTLFFYLFFYH